MQAKNERDRLRKRLKALDAKAAQEHIVLTEEQLRALERAREEKEAHGEIETAHPGYLGAQDTYYVGTIKSVGRIYQQTFLDTYTKVAFAKQLNQRQYPVPLPILRNETYLEPVVYRRPFVARRPAPGVACIPGLGRSSPPTTERLNSFLLRA